MQSPKNKKDILDLQKFSLKLVGGIDNIRVLCVVLICWQTHTATDRWYNQGQGKSSNGPGKGERRNRVSVDKSLVPAFGKAKVDCRRTS